jgi:hypothetical protein
VLCIMKIPTMTRAGAVATAGMARKRGCHKENGQYEWNTFAEVGQDIAEVEFQEGRGQRGGHGDQRVRAGGQSLSWFLAWHE